MPSLRRSRRSQPAVEEAAPLSPYVGRGGSVPSPTSTDENVSDDDDINEDVDDEDFEEGLDDENGSNGNRNMKAFWGVVIVVGVAVLAAVAGWGGGGGHLAQIAEFVVPFSSSGFDNSGAAGYSNIESRNKNKNSNKNKNKNKNNMKSHSSGSRKKSGRKAAVAKALPAGFVKNAGVTSSHLTTVAQALKPKIVVETSGGLRGGGERVVKGEVGASSGVDSDDGSGSGNYRNEAAWVGEQTCMIMLGGVGVDDFKKAANEVREEKSVLLLQCIRFPPILARLFVALTACLLNYLLTYLPLPSHSYNIPHIP